MRHEFKTEDRWCVRMRRGVGATRGAHHSHSLTPAYHRRHAGRIAPVDWARRAKLLVYWAVSAGHVVTRCCRCSRRRGPFGDGGGGGGGDTGRDGGGGIQRTTSWSTGTMVATPRAAAGGAATGPTPRGPTLEQDVRTLALEQQYHDLVARFIDMAEDASKVSARGAQAGARG